MLYPLKHLLKHIFKGGGGANLSKIQLRKMVKNKQSFLIGSVEMLNIGVINKYTYYKLKNRGGGAIQDQLITNYFSQFFLISPPSSQLFFSINCIRNRLLHVSFVELFDFIIY